MVLHEKMMERLKALRRVVLLLSGGYDSATCLYLLLEQGIEVHPLFVSLGQKATIQEYTAARNLCEDTEAAANLVVQACMLPSSEKVSKFKPAEGVAADYVPGRNSILAALGYALACDVGANAVMLGISGDEHHMYPDQRPSWVGATQPTFDINNRALHPDLFPIKLLAPLLSFTRAETLCLGKELGVPFQHVWSCYNPNADGEPCGICGSCKK